MFDDGSIDYQGFKFNDAELNESQVFNCYFYFIVKYSNVLYQYFFVINYYIFC
jgi:hypothetical protein